MACIAIFSAPKSFAEPHISIIQRNAILSWKTLGESVEIWLVGNEEGVEQAACELGVNYIPNVDRNSSGTPRIDSIFNRVREESHANYLCYVNADILLFPDIIGTLEIVRKTRERFLLVGQRWDMNIKALLPMGSGWDTLFLERLELDAKLHVPAGSDYFIFPRHLFTDIPPFAIGRAGWDNWMIYHGRHEHMAVIDATGSITAVHQNHDFKHLPGGKIHRRQPESLENLNLAGGRHTLFTLADTNKKIVDGKIVNPRFTRDYLRRAIGILPLLYIKPDWLGKAVYTLINPGRVIQDYKKDRRMKENIAKTSRESK
ncbi:MAG: hypothetical protein A2X25_06640 [Chloroflexi bacterium GWB2_49_20]|nr:MAG: hypothetical protein A2X25_06640 [Chloroflexi bacterium GWB2_49_20]OGN80283.1 MAG: hypothetical protein A2X26_08140 [Chloroflexi bacterium GWC2_49_37]OGN86077.1 MAG: hypothetical protein A2X27_00605 [Chloroflexi bacterium GWD2_49_16]HCC79380.1 hypothetical protein [Anaerolineae bacterium]HCM96399.1 hypothetical protein [Anaerolineae bacterium]